MALFRIELKNGKWIEVEQNIAREFKVVNENMTAKDGDWISDATALGFRRWDESVQDLDDGHSDASQCFNISMHLKWNEVELRPRKFKAPSIERLKEALNHVTIGAWCPGDI